MKQKLLLITCLIFGFNGLFAQTTVNTNITSNQTWTKANSPYIIAQNITIDASAKLTIMPGTRIRNANNFIITVKGGVEAIGKFDTLITIDTVKFLFDNSSMGYNFSTNTGSQFDYCLFRGNTGYMAIQVDQTPLLVKNTKFSGFTYVARQITSTATSFVKLRFEDCVFEKGSYNSYIVWPFGTKTELEMEKCTATNHQGGLMMATKNKITNCLFYNWTSSLGIDMYMSRYAEIRCNTFRKFNKYIIQFPIGGFYESYDCIIENNTFDSSNNHIEYYVNNLMTNSGTGIWSVKNNNFLYYVNNSVYITRKTNSGYVDTLDFRGNFWNTTNLTTIGNGITDFVDNNFVSTVVDFSSPLSTKVGGCPVVNTCPVPYFNYTNAQNYLVEFNDSSVGSYYYKVKWHFGDGTKDETDNKKPKHDYTKSGTYTACLYVYTTNNELCDSFCKTIVVEEPKCKAKFNFGVSVNNPETIYVFDNSKGVWWRTKYEWEILGYDKYNYTPYTIAYTSSSIQLCLTIDDGKCRSVFCDSITQKSNFKYVEFSKGPESKIDEAKNEVFKVFPNPATDKLSISGLDDAAESTLLEFRDISGRLIKTEQIEGKVINGFYQWDIGDLSNGLYLITIKTNLKSETKTIGITK